jgi:tetratricopeptide (TPR) repeat protein/uncharacterized membrane protein YvlD (DUF360 family)
MSESPNKLIKFWQELKRRKVFSVVTTYAATSYIIIEVVNNLIGPLHLPDWLATLVVILLTIGLPVAVIAAWIFDFTPQGIKKTESLEESESKEIVIKPVKRKLRASYVLNAILIIVVLILAYPKVFKRDTLESLRAKGKISVAVMPFQNMTGDTAKNIWQDWIQDNLINTLSSYPEELEVRQTELVNSLIPSKVTVSYASITPSFAKAISQKLDANVFIYGNLKMAGTTIRLDAQLVDSKTGEILKPFQIEGSAEEENIFQIIDSVSEKIRNFLIISKLKKEVYLDPQRTPSSTSLEAYRHFTDGLKFFGNRDYPVAIDLLSKAVAIDSNLTYAILHISFAYGNMGIYGEAKEWCLRAYKKRDQMPLFQKTYTNMHYADLFETPFEAIKYWKQLQEIDDHWPHLHYGLGFRYNSLNQYDKAILEFEKSLEMYDKMGIKPYWSSNYFQLGLAYYRTGQFRKEKKLFKRADQDFPDEYRMLALKTILSLTEGDTVRANECIKKFIFQRKLRSVSEAEITTSIGNMYSEAGIPDIAEEYYRKALSLEPEKPLRMNNLAFFLIDKDRKIEEGLQLARKALELNPDNYDCLHTRGWGLYKQGKYKEALDLLQESWDIRVENAIYDHAAYLHLEAAKKAVASQKNN